MQVHKLEKTSRSVTLFGQRSPGYDLVRADKHVEGTGRDLGRSELGAEAGQSLQPLPGAG